MDGCVLYSPLPHSSLGQAIWTRLKLGSFYNTIIYIYIYISLMDNGGTKTKIDG